MSNLKEYDFPVVRYRNGKPATFFRNKIVYAELHEKAVKRIAQLETELAEARKALVALHLAASALAGYDDMGSALNYYERVEEKHTTAIEKAREAEKGGVK